MKRLTLDTETTGTDTENDRIITCFMRARDGDEIVFEKNWVIDPGVEIPEGASDVHGMTTEWVRENGRKDVSEAIKEIHRQLLSYASYEEYIVVGYNSAFDLAILDAEVRRHKVGGSPKMGLGDARFLDPCIFSRHFDKFKKGGHKLITAAKRNGIEIEEDRLHAADYDVEVTEKLTTIMLNRAWRELSDLRKGLTPDEFITKLQEWQEIATRKWAEDTTAYFEKVGKRDEEGNPIIVRSAFPW